VETCDVGEPGPSCGIQPGRQQDRRDQRPAPVGQVPRQRPPTRPRPTAPGRGHGSRRLITNAAAAGVPRSLLTPGRPRLPRRRPRSRPARRLANHWPGPCLDGQAAVTHELLAGFPPSVRAADAQLATVAAATAGRAGPGDDRIRARRRVPAVPGSCRLSRCRGAGGAALPPRCFGQDEQGPGGGVDGEHSQRPGQVDPAEVEDAAGGGEPGAGRQALAGTRPPRPGRRPAAPALSPGPPVSAAAAGWPDCRRARRPILRRRPGLGRPGS
jgi:hypothetical protein